MLLSITAICTDILIASAFQAGGFLGYNIFTIIMSDCIYKVGNAFGTATRTSVYGVSYLCTGGSLSLFGAIYMLQNLSIFCCAAGGAGEGGEGIGAAFASLGQYARIPCVCLLFTCALVLAGHGVPMALFIEAPILRIAVSMLFARCKADYKEQDR